MFPIYYQLTRVFAFSSIKEVGWGATFRIFPLIFSLLIGMAYFLLPVRPSLVGADGLCRLLELVFSVLPGFFIAALAAVATFGKKELDFEMPEPAPTLVLRLENKEEPAPLTLRMFLSLMFSYLTGVSLIALIFCIGVEMVTPSARLLISSIKCHSDIWRTISKIPVVMVLVWLVSKIMLTTFLGLYFLGERIHRPAA